MAPNAAEGPKQTNRDADAASCPDQAPPSDPAVGAGSYTGAASARKQ